MISFKNFIGCEIEVLYSKNRGLKGLSGKVVFESKNMLFIEKDGKIKKIPKHGSVFLIKLDDKEIIVQGEFLARRFIKLKKIARTR